jgi:hypothetical protein
MHAVDSQASLLLAISQPHYRCLEIVNTSRSLTQLSLLAMSRLAPPSRTKYL